jgi:hypothetical protein
LYSQREDILKQYNQNQKQERKLTVHADGEILKISTTKTISYSCPIIWAAFLRINQNILKLEKDHYHYC